ncbi:MAG TPA: TIGR03560 family F420-dependent LLM class oxidoreductase [Myxococcota bacterium]|nr:TIGR03560 family F420-dependent LLM class oxidoreductase [Myxococcota bacterium]
MKLGLWPAPHVAWPDLLALAEHAERTGWDAIWYADHFMPVEGDPQAPVRECFTSLAALAVAVPRIRIGSLVAGNTYRHPAVLAKMAATLDELSSGRFELGLGAAWQENEHRAYGIAFGSVGERLDRLEEACEVIRGLFGGGPVSFAGRHYRLDGAVLSPRPVQRVLPLLVGGGGERRTLRIAARFADGWNVWGRPELLRHKGAVLDARCGEVGRDPAAIRRTAVAHVFVVDDPERAARLAARPRATLAGDGDALRAELRAYADAGVDELVVPFFEAEPIAERIARADALRTALRP